MPEQMREEVDDLEAFADQIRDEGVTDVLLLGMGGSSLAPEVIRRSFGDQDGRPRLRVLDSTDAGAVRAAEAAIDLPNTLFVVSMKSGGTIETLSLLRHFFGRRPHGEAFVAITDPGSGLEQLAHEHGFRRTFLNDPEIGGRYGWVLGINPFDQPDVQEAKDATARALTDGVPDQPDAGEDELRALLDGLGPPSYLALLAYVAPSPQFDAAAAELRTTIRDATGAATTFGYGPRYLHSTGQLHKGGPPTGRFLQVMHDAGPELEIPGAGYGFARLKHAQAIGDLEALRAHALPAERVTLDGEDAAAGLRALAERLRSLL